MNILDVGCGNNKVAGAFGVDQHPFPDVDLVHDLDHLPWPLADNTYDEIYARHIIEHVADPTAMMNEIHRVARPGAVVHLVTPHFSNRCAFLDPTHRRALSVRAFDFFSSAPERRLSRPARISNLLFEHRFFYRRLEGARPFKPLALRLSFSRWFRWCGIAWLANHCLDFYEFYGAWIFPARDIHVSLRVEKK